MPDQPPIAKTMDIDLVKHQLPSVIQRVSNKEARVLIEQSGVPMAAIVSIDDLERLQQLDQEWEQTTQGIVRLSQTFADIPVADLEAKIDEIIADNRAKEVAVRRTA